MKISDLHPLTAIVEAMTEDEHAEMRKRFHFAKSQPHPFPFDGTPHSDTVVNTEGFRFLKPADFDAAAYLYSTGIDDPKDLAELAVMLSNARRWERLQHRRTMTGDQTDPKEHTLHWKECFDWAVMTYDQIGLDYFTGEHTPEPMLTKKKLRKTAN